MYPHEDSVDLLSAEAIRRLRGEDPICNTTDPIDGLKVRVRVRFRVRVRATDPTGGLKVTIISMPNPNPKP